LSNVQQSIRLPLKTRQGVCVRKAQSLDKVLHCIRLGPLLRLQFNCLKFVHFQGNDTGERLARAARPVRYLSREPMSATDQSP
jgi:hypothetical protein